MLGIFYTVHSLELLILYWSHLENDLISNEQFFKFFQYDLYNTLRYV